MVLDHIFPHPKFKIRRSAPWRLIPTLGTHPTTDGTRTLAVRLPTQNATIFRLHEDILYHIFSLNADMSCQPIDKRIPSHDNLSFCFQHSALSITRYSSQVCYLWRTLILSSPTLWGGIIDLDNLRGWRKDSSAWPKEVLSRSGSALLSVKGCLAIEDEEKLSFLTTLFSIQLHRIRMLNIKIVNHDKPIQDITRNIANTLLQPAPNLQSFKIQYCGELFLDKPAPQALALFADEAPALRHFGFTEYPLSSHRLEAPWFIHIKHLSTSFSCSVAELLSALSQMSSLEILELDHCNLLKAAPRSAPSLQPLQNALLPSLKALEIGRGTLKTSFPLFQYIFPAAGCLISISFDDVEEGDLEIPLSPEELDAIRSTVSRYTQNYFDYWSRAAPEKLSSQISIIVSAHHCEFHLGHDFSIHLWCDENIFVPRPVIAAIFNGLADQSTISTFAHVEKAEIAFVNHVYFYYTGPEGVENLTAFRRLLCHLQNVEVLTDHELGLGALQVIRYLSSITDADTTAVSIVLPNLRTLKIYRLCPISIEFVHRWRQWGRIAVMDLLDFESRDMGFLGRLEDDLRGIKLRWKSKSNDRVMEWICGTARSVDIMY